MFSSERCSRAQTLPVARDLVCPMPLFALRPPAAPRPAPLHAQQRLSLPPREPGSSLWEAKPFQDAASHPVAARRGPVPSLWGCAVPGVRPQSPGHAWWDLPPARAQERQVYWGPKPRLCGCSRHKANCSVTHRGGAVTVLCSPGPEPCSPGEAVRLRPAHQRRRAQCGSSGAWPGRAAGAGTRHQPDSASPLLSNLLLFLARFLTRPLPAAPSSAAASVAASSQ